MKSNKSLKKFCRLTKYIEQVDPQLYQAIDDLCINHYFKPNARADGVTFLFPQSDAYRKKIINSAYSTDPEAAVNMIKSLILQGYYGSAADFNGGVTNLLNQMINVDSIDGDTIKFSNGLTAKKADDFVPMSYRENMAVFELHGKGEIPLEGEAGAPKKKKVGGGFFESGKHKLHKLLEDRYVNEIGKDNNIYAKKVRLHLKLLSEHNISSDALQYYLGNDEISDSYLLDMYCTKHCSKCFDVLRKALERDDSRINNITHEDYIAAKKQLLGPEPHNKNVHRDASLLRGLRSPIEVRTRVCDEYKHNKEQLGKDLFIVFCNISKDLWLTSSSKVDDFKNFALIVSKIYTTPNDLLNQEFDAVRDLTLYGNLLKSDVFKYRPQADFKDPSSVSLKVVAELPTPIDMSLFSLCALVNKKKNVVGGDPEVELLLNDL